jgi:hypothetical protein
MTPMRTAQCRQYARLAKHYDEQIRLQEQAAAAAQAEIDRADVEYRNQAQLKHTRREWDLNRPDTLRIDKPAREGDTDARCGAASMQVCFSLAAVLEKSTVRSRK